MTSEIKFVRLQNRQIEYELKIRQKGRYFLICYASVALTKASVTQVYGGVWRLHEVESSRRTNLQGGNTNGSDGPPC